MKIKDKTVLTFSAHPDDVEYYAGGTLLKLTSANNKLVQVVVTNGEINGEASERKKEQEKQVIFSFDPENQFRVQEDTHPDHRALSLIITEDLVLVYSNLPAYIRKIGLNLKPLQAKPELWLFNAKEPNHFEDVSHFWLQKKKLLKVFKSQRLNFEGLKIEGFHRISFCSKIEVNGD